LKYQHIRMASHLVDALGVQRIAMAIGGAQRER